MIASSFYIMRDISLVGPNTISKINILVILGTILLLQFTRFIPPLIVMVCLLLGYFL